MMSSSTQWTWVQWGRKWKRTCTQSWTTLRRIFTLSGIMLPSIITKIPFTIELLSESRRQVCVCACACMCVCACLCVCLYMCACTWLQAWKPFWVKWLIPYTYIVNLKFVCVFLLLYVLLCTFISPHTHYTQKRSIHVHPRHPSGYKILEQARYQLASAGVDHHTGLHKPEVQEPPPLTPNTTIQQPADILETGKV